MPEFLTSANADSKKNVSFEYSEIVGSLPEKDLYLSHLINQTLLKQSFHTFLREYWENCSYESFGKLSKKLSLIAFLLKNSSCPIHPSSLPLETKENGQPRYIREPSPNC